MNTVCHIEIMTSDLASAQAFYAQVFPSWTFRQFGDEMVVFGVGDAHVGGFMKTDTVKPGNSPSVWIQVEDIEPVLARATEAGGTVACEKYPVPSVGWSAQFNDPEGSSIGIVQFGDSA